MNDRYDVLIVGGGHGGAQAALALRQHGFAGTVAIAGDEPELPYERPPLSKDYLVGEKEWERMLLRPAQVWADKAVTLLPATKVVAVDAAAHTVTAEDGRTIGYGSLIWATGGSPRRLSCSGNAVRGVHTIRTRADVDALLGELPAVEQAVVIGGGYIGLEAAASLRKLGKQVVLIEALDRVLARVAGEDLSRFFAAEHRAQGVDLRLSTAVDCIVDEDGRATGVLAIHFDWEPQARSIVEGVRLAPAEAARSRVLLIDAANRVIAASDGRGILTERFPIDTDGQKSGVRIDHAGRIVAFHETPGYETYRGLGWRGVIEQHPE